MFPPFTDEHDQLRALARDFAEREIAPNSAAWDAAGEWPHREIFRQLAELGLLGIRYPDSVGGMGLDWWYTTAFVEGLGHARNGGVVMSILVDTDMATPIIGEIGTEEQKQEFLAPVVRGEKIAALGVSEPDCGSDVAAIRTTAKKDGTDYVINGQKTYITNGAIADFITLAVRTGGEGHGGISLVLFPTDTPGFSVGRKLDKLGTRSVDSCELHFDNCRIPQRYLLGHENAGFYYIMTNFQGERLVAALTAIHSMELALGDAIRFGSERKAFGRPVAKFQVWKHKLAEHLASLEAAKALTYQAVQRMQTGEDPTKLVSMAKLFSCDLAQRVIYDCQQLHGGAGYIEEYPITRLARDVRLLTIGGGTSEVMKEIVWKWTEMGG
ncbi:MAG: acyl-CoA dehydrogenase family protein [Myxococcales bacterium]|nr:acyl-CoA dehydrogenase family protein [Myxococcales bacterium]MCB9672370.1 acyl-CoA dehydrogenase family protein [Alphaproteobacteria bacterium]